ncbi:MAG: hypothetical protein AMXMBFR16_03480 [Candidatus Uhrbacteria bacterium]|jgi:type II secretory pathway pseudopilin PulG|uniref:Prepilin-type N-terminal cleavage/methylation domain-containing protein n=1 Tax=candidate division WWE3 bacterium TaxID=2053526 RepID=A0A928Y6Z2_UNCKA|nr:hypothetical protein [candidate division WWE3 bacterium]
MSMKAKQRTSRPKRLAPAKNIAEWRHRGVLRGQSLIELLIAMTVIIVGLTAAGSLIFSNIRLQEQSTERVIASNLAREGVELAKAARDSNWLAGLPFDNGLYEPTEPDYTAVPRMDGGEFIDFEFGPDLSVPSPALRMKRSAAASSTGLFVQGTGSTGSDTPYERIMILQPICSDGVSQVQASDGQTCNNVLAGSTKIGIRVLSRVSWTSRGINRSTYIVDELYDWR